MYCLTRDAIEGSHNIYKFAVFHTLLCERKYKFSRLINNCNNTLVRHMLAACAYDINCVQLCLSVCLSVCLRVYPLFVASPLVLYVLCLN